MPADLRKANVSIVGTKFCNSSGSYNGLIHPGMVCANGLTEEGALIDVCQGDSGGGLTCDGKLVGLASFGVQCGLQIYFPGVFVNVYYYKDWIMDNWSAASAMAHSKFVLLLILTYHVVHLVNYQ